jgi:hypothetical protein
VDDRVLITSLSYKQAYKSDEEENVMDNFFNRDTWPYTVQKTGRWSA